MKKPLRKITLISIISFLFFSNNSAFACANRGNIKVDTSRCDISRAKLWLVNHTMTVGTQFFWESSNDGGINWATMATNSDRDTQLIPLLYDRLYRCRSVCSGVPAYSDTFRFSPQARTITVDQKICGILGGGDSLVLKLATFSNVNDSNFAKNIKWQVSSVNGEWWNDIGGNTPTLRVLFTPNIIQYRAYVTFCKLTGPVSSYPTSMPSFVAPVRIGLKDIGLTVSNKDCVNDSATLGLTNVRSSLAALLRYNWLDSNQSSVAYTSMGKTNSSLKVKVDNVNRFYKSSVKLCPNSNESEYTSTHAMWVKLGELNSVVNCGTENIELDYTHRNLARKSVHLYWTRSQNDSLSHSSFTDPIDSVKYSILLTNGINNYYKVYSKFCPTSSNILDSSINLNVKLKIDTGLLKGSFKNCTNDSVYLTLNNYKVETTLPINRMWMLKNQGSETWKNLYETDGSFDIIDDIDTILKFRMQNGLNQYRYTSTFCNGKFSKNWSSTVARTFLPFQPIYQASCTGSMTINVLNDTVKLVDYTGTIIRNNSTFAYQWLRSTNKISSTIVAGATSSNLTINQADRGLFFKRLTRICSANTFSDTTNWSNFTVGKPTTLNGKAIVADQICLNEMVNICIDNFTPLSTETPTYVWQSSPDDIHWSNMNTSNSNDICITALVTPDFKYFRRLTFWCPSGRVDSSNSTPLIYIKNLPWFESFTAQVQFGRDILFNCWRSSSPVCNAYSSTYTGGQIWSRATGGKSDKSISNWGPIPQDPRIPRRNDMKLITPAFALERGKVYRFSFWHKEDAPNVCWDSLYVTWGKKPNPCDMTNKFGEQLTKFSFDQDNKFWSDFSPPDDGIYYFAINLRESSATTGEVFFDEIGLKEIESCEGRTPIRGRTVAPSKLVHRSEEPDVFNNYDKSNVTHQYCLHDTIMLTYEESNYVSNFDYHGMRYQFWKKRSDQDWQSTDTFFKSVPSDNNCHITNRADYHVMNVLVTDTHTWYKIVATCIYDGKEYHSDSLLVNGTHSVPYCENWEGIGGISGNLPPVSFLANGNSSQIRGRVPLFIRCPSCWAAYPQQNENLPPLSAPGASASDQSLYSVTLPFFNPPPGPPALPQVSPDAGYSGNNVVMITDNRTINPTLRKILVMPAMRLYKGRGYRISFRWSDNRMSAQSPWGNVNQDLDSLYVVAVKGNRSGRTKDSFPFSKMISGSLRKDVQSNILENGTAKYRTYWQDFTPNDTGTYYFGVVVVAGTNNGNAYRFVMDYFCIDTIPVDDCSQDGPKFRDPLKVRINPDGKTWSPGDTAISNSGKQWCAGIKINLELDFGLSSNNAWKYGWKYYWQRTTNDWRLPPANKNPNHPSIIWTTIDSSNGINFVLTYKFQDYRLILSNSCNTKFDTIGPFRINSEGGKISCVVGNRETFLNLQFNKDALLPQCWDVYPPCRVKVLDDNGVGNEFRQTSKLHKNYLNMDFISPASGSCPISAVQTAVPPGYGLVSGTTYRFSFWYKDNGISVPIDSIVAGYSFQRPTDAIQFRLLNKVNNDIVKNSRTNKWRYYTTEIMSAIDTEIHYKIKTYNIGNKRIYHSMFDDLMFKPKQNIDALVIAIDSPDYACDLTENSTVKVTVMNIGNNSITDLPITIQVGSSTPISFIVTGSLASNETRTVYVPNIDLSKVGENTIKAWTDAPGEQFVCDDTFTTKIIHNEMPTKPTDTVDSVCICNSHTMTAPYNNARWYRNATDATPIYEGGDFTIDSICKDTSFYYSQWNGGVCYTYPPNFSYGAPTYRVPTVGGATPFGEGITFDNISKDTILIDSVMVYVNTLTAPLNFNVNLTQFVGGQTTLLKQIPSMNFTRLGKQWIPIKIKVPPGTDYKLLYAGTSALAQLSGFIFIGAGCNTMDINFNGDENYPAPAASYKYFFNWKIIKLGCETERVKKNIIAIPSPKFALKDTTRVCSQPVFLFCGPAAPVGQTYKYQWASALANDTNLCKKATTTGWYKLSVTNEFGCMETDSTEVIVDPSPEFTLGNDTSFCKFSPYTLRTGLDSADNVVTWSDNQSGVSIKILNPGTFIATAYNTQNFCKAKDTINVIRHELPLFSLGNDRVFCGASANIQALAPHLPTSLTYTWGGPNPVPSINKSGTYWVEGFDPMTGCKTRDSIVAGLQPNPSLELGPDVMACGSLYTINTAINGNYFYKWSTTATSRTLSVARPGTYFLTVTNKDFGCESVDSIKINFKRVPIFDLGPNVVKCATTHLISGPISPSGETYNYAWKKPNGNFKSGGQTLIADVSGVYYLKVDNDCYNFTDSLRITLKTPPMDAIDLLKDTVGCKKANLQTTSTSTYTSLVWSAPAGSSVNGSNANMVLADKTGTYTVSLTNECGTASKAVFVRIDEAPLAKFTINYLDSANDCMSIVLKNQSSHANTYLWTFGDGKNSNLEQPLHIYEIEGSFLVTLKAYNSCGFSTATLITKKRDKKCSTLGIHNQNGQETNLSLYPNPAKETTLLSGLGLANGIYKLVIRNILGQTIVFNEVKVTSNELKETLDISKLASGDYLIELSNESETLVRKLQIIK